MDVNDATVTLICTESQDLLNEINKRDSKLNVKEAKEDKTAVAVCIACRSAVSNPSTSTGE